MQYELGVQERVMLSMILPRMGNATNLKLVREMRERLSFNAEEHEELKLVTDEGSGQAKWDLDAEEKQGPVTFTFNRIERRIIQESLKRVLVQLNKNETLTDGHLDVGEKFLDGPNFDKLLKELEKQAEVQEKAREEAEAKKLAEAEAKKLAEAENDEEEADASVRIADQREALVAGEQEDPEAEPIGD